MWTWTSVSFDEKAHSRKGIIALLNRRLPDLSRFLGVLSGYSRGLGTFTDADTTPLITGAGTWICANSGATSITNFDGGVNGQMIDVKLDANTTIVHGTPIKLAGGANLVGTANDMVSFRLIDDVWYERGRSVNG